jgi:hypothetical protein
LLIILLWPWNGFLNRGALFNEATLSWRVRSGVSTEASLHMFYIPPDIQVGKFLQDFGGQIHRGRIFLSLL